MKDIGFGKTLSSRVFISMALIAFCMCAFSTFMLARLSSGAVDGAVRQRDNDWAKFMPAAIGSVTGEESQQDLATLLGELQKDYSTSYPTLLGMNFPQVLKKPRNLREIDKTVRY